MEKVINELLKIHALNDFKKIKDELHNLIFKLAEQK